MQEKITSFSKLKEIWQIYEGSFSVRKFVHWERSGIVQLRKYIEALTKKPKEYQLTKEDLFELLQIIKGCTSLNLVTQIIKEFFSTYHDVFIEIVTIADNYNILDQETFNYIDQISQNNSFLVGMQCFFIMEGSKKIRDLLNLSELKLKRKIFQAMIIGILNKLDYSNIRDIFIKFQELKLINLDNLALFFIEKNQFLNLYLTLIEFDKTNLLKQKSLSSLQQTKDLSLIRRILDFQTENNLVILNDETLAFICQKENMLIDPVAFFLLMKFIAKYHYFSSNLFKKLFTSENLYYYNTALVLLESLGFIQNTAIIELIFSLNQEITNYNKIITFFNENDLLTLELVQALVKQISNVDNVWFCLNYEFFKKEETFDQPFALNILKDAIIQERLQTSDLHDFLKILEGLHLVLHKETFSLACQSHCFNEITQYLKKLYSKYRGDQTFLLILQPKNINSLLKLTKVEWDDFVNLIDTGEFTHLSNQQNLNYILEFVKSTSLKNIRPNSQLNVTTQIIQEQNINNLSLQNLYLLLQNLIETYYLQPYPPKKIKQNLKDGVIEREVHGAMHATRVALYVKVLHQLLLQIVPDYVNIAVNRLTKEFNLTQDIFIVSCIIAALMHDAARENESEDKWEKESATYCKEILSSFNIPSKMVQLLQSAIQFKDQPKEFNKYLLSIGIDEPNSIYYQYPKILIYLADCFDIIRCSREFLMKYVFNCVAVIPGYQSSAHDNQLISFAKEAHQLIRNQKDMLFDCKIILPNNDEVQLACPGRHYSLNHKVKIEQSENVLAIISQEMLKQPFFATLLASDPTLTASYATHPAAFNPYIHGTTSLVFTTLEQTHNALMPTLQMLKHFNLAPMGGELDSRGLENASYNGAQIAYGRMRIFPKRHNHYDLEKILSSYANHTQASIQNMDSVLTALKKEIAKGSTCHFDNIILILIYTARARQLGVSTSVLINDIKINEIINELKKPQFSKTSLFEDSIRILDNLMLTQLDTEFSKRQQFFIQNRFPVIFICEEEYVFELNNFSTYELRSKNHLRIGQEIKMIATDTEKNSLILMKYLDENQIRNVTVVLFVDLYLSQYTNSKPKSYFTHSDGFERLSWLTAKKIHNCEQKVPNEKVKKLLEMAEIYQAINLPSC